MKYLLNSTISILFFSATAFAQKKTIDFKAEDIGNNKIRISWANQYEDSCIQLMVQASWDSTKNFKTIFSSESPQLPQNGFVYTMPFQANFYYRVFYILSTNQYFFSPSKRAVVVEITKDNVTAIPKDKEDAPKIDPIRIITIRTKDSIVAKVKYSDYYHFKDSLARNTKDTLFVLSETDVLIRPFNPENYFRPSPYVMTNRDGFITIRLPEAATKKYRINFLEMDGRKIFSISHVSESELVIDKTNFMHAGWFKFELYENDKLKEKNKVLLQRDF